MRIATEGVPTILWGLTFSLIAWTTYAIFPPITVIPGVFFSFLTLGIVFFFRDPERISPTDELLILSPADGRVLPFSQVETPAGERMISVFLSLFDVHINRSPVNGTVERVEYRPGRFLIASRREALEQNEMNRISFRTPAGELTVQQVAGALARRVVCHLKEGQVVRAGERIGIMKFGSRMDLILPANIEIQVKPGDKVYAGVSLIGVWKDETK